jgi:hypothetical protein
MWQPNHKAVMEPRKQNCPCCRLCDYPCPWGGPFLGYIFMGTKDDKDIMDAQGKEDDDT